MQYKKHSTDPGVKMKKVCWCISGKTILRTFKMALMENVSKGKYVKKFEDNFKDFIGTKYASSTSSCRHALYLALNSFKINKGVDEIIVPALMPAVVLKVIDLCGLKPVFADVSPSTLNVSPEEIEKKITKNTKFVLLVHLHGIPCEIEQILKIVKKHNLFLIEDCAQAIGSRYNGAKVGTYGDVSTFSFGFAKTLTTFGGGMVLTNNKEIHDNVQSQLQSYPSESKKQILANFLSNSAKWAFFRVMPLTIISRILLNKSFKNKEFDFRDINRLMDKTTNPHEIQNLSESLFISKYCHKLSNLKAFIGLEQLKHYDVLLNRQETNYMRFKKLIKKPLVFHDKISPVLFLYYVEVDDPSSTWIELYKSGFICPIHFYYDYLNYPIFKKYDVDCPVAEKITKKFMYIPFKTSLTDKDCNKISKIINKHQSTTTTF